MGGNRHERTIEIFNDALDVDTGERSAFLAAACAGDSSLVRDVRSLLATAKDAPGSGLLAPPRHGHGWGRDNGHDHGDGGGEASAGLSVPPAALTGDRIGAYTVLDILGEGGMGVVYRAEQDSPHRTVALKVIRPGRLGPGARRRFEYEADVLGRLHHPGIAQVYEAGTAETPHGACPFFAMELIEGRPLIEYADAEGLDLRARLALMAKVCDAVDHAHRNGVIHRDLKPANLLVDGDGRPKILDFGVARATDSDVGVTVQTSVGELIGTLHYMSPEQCEGDPRALDTRSDIYALGVVCWELLSGELPYDVKGKPIPEAIRVIREEPPRTLGSMSSVMRGDVETIVAKAIEKEREQRYQSASSLACDIRRFLRHEPIVARPPSTIYQLARFDERNRGIVTALAAVFVVLVAGIVATSRATMQARSKKVAAEYFSEIQDGRVRHNEAVLAAALRSDPADPDAFAAVAAAMQQAGAPVSPAGMHQVVGDVYARLGRYDLAERHLRRALDDGDAEEPSLRSVGILAEVLRQAGKLWEAETLLVRALERAGDVPTADSRYASEAETTRALRILGLRQQLGDVRRDQGALDAAEAILRDTLAATRQVFASEHARPEEVAEVHDIDESPLVRMTRRSLATVALARARYADAEQRLRELVDVDRGKPGRDVFVSGWLEHQLGLALLEQGRLEDSTSLIEEASAVLSDAYGSECMEALRATTTLARLRLAQDRPDEAETLLTFVVDAADHRYPDHWQTAVFRGDYGRVLARRARYDESRAALIGARDRLTELFGADDYRVRRLLRLLDLRGSDGGPPTSATTTPSTSTAP